MKIHVDSKRFDSKQIFDGLDLELAPSEFLAVAGPSGCGKTTLLRLIAGLDTDAKMTLSGAGDVISYVFQEPRLLPWRTIRENLLLACPDTAAGMERADQALKTIKLWEDRDEFPDALSLGMKRRVELARALAVDPGLILLDEPFVSLDSAAAAELRELVLAVWMRERPSIIMVSHDLKECVQLADRLIVLNGRPATILHELKITHPRDQRDSSWVETQLAEINRACDF